MSVAINQTLTQRQKKGGIHALLVGIKITAIILQNSMEIHQKIEVEVTYDVTYATPGYVFKEIKLDC